MGIPGALNTMHLNSNILKPGSLRDNSTATSAIAGLAKKVKFIQNFSSVN